MLPGFFSLIMFAVLGGSLILSGIADKKMKILCIVMEVFICIAIIIVILLYMAKVALVLR